MLDCISCICGFKCKRDLGHHESGGAVMSSNTNSTRRKRRQDRKDLTCHRMPREIKKQYKSFIGDEDDEEDIDLEDGGVSSAH